MTLIVIEPSVRRPAMAVTAFLVGSILLAARITCTSTVGVTVSSDNPVACSQSTVTFTCTVDSGRGLEWMAEPFITDEENQVVFIATDLEKNPNRTVISNGVTFHAALTHVDPVPGSAHFTFQSTLSTTASNATNGTLIVCQEPLTDVSDNVTLQLRAPGGPPRPFNVSYNVNSCHTSNVTGDIEWDSFTDSSIDNFTITVSSLDGSTDLMTTVESSPLNDVILNYNINYTISVIGRNCAGSSIPTQRFYMEYGCPAPSEPVNGSVSGFTCAMVGSEVTYQCDTGLLLVGERVAVCTSDLVWVPNSSEVICQHPLPGDCGDPGELTNGTVIFSTSGTRDGSVITFQCDPGFSLVGDRVSQCRSGQWTVLPQDVLCTADTGTSTSPTTTSSSQSTLSAGAIAGIVVGVSLAICLGVLSLVIVFIFCTTRTSEKTTCGSGTAGENSYIPGGEGVELQQMNEHTTLPATYSTVQAQENGAGQYSTPVISSAVTTTSKSMQYADVGPSSAHSVPPPTAAQDKVQYSTVDHTQEAPPQPVAGPPLHPLDRDINPEVIQRQIVELRPQWRSFGSAAGLPHQFLDEVHSSYTDNKDRLAEVVYEWYGRMRTVTWADVAGMCRKIGNYDLADALEKVYDTGVLPFRDDEKLPLTPSSKDLPPPPLPPREDSETPPPELPPPPPPDALDDLPSRPPKPSPRHESPVAKAPLAPPRPPKPSTKPHLPPRT